MADFHPALRRRLEAIDAAGLRRTIEPPAGVDLASNDYLGLARDPELQRRAAARLRDLPCGASASRLLRGHLAVHDEAEAALARLAGREAALLFPSGYQANLALLSSLLREGDVVYSDALNHASIIDGVRLGRAERRIYPHADVAALAAMLERDDRPLRVIVTESLFSMDGDQAPLADLAALARKHGALLVVDEAHATGLFGARGGGLVQAHGIERDVFATVHTGGKALGAGGAFVAGDAALRDYLINCARPFLFTTAPIPALAALLVESIRYLEEVGAARAGAVLRRAAALRRRLARHDAGAAAGAGPGSSPAPVAPNAAARPVHDGPIVPLILGDNGRAVAVAAALRRAGFDARAVRPPTVPEGTARLRLTVTWPVGEAALARFGDALEAALAAEGAP